MKKILTISACLLFSVAVFGQYKGGLWSYTYDISFGLGETSDFIGAASFRGMSIAGSGFVTDKIAIGGSFGWTTFYEKTNNKTEEFDFIDDDGERVTGALWGTQYRYINSFPILVTAKWYSKNPVFETFSFFAGLGAGTSIIKRRLEIGVIAIDETKWHFTIAPEVGLVYGLGEGVKAFLSGQYYYSLKTNETPSHSQFTLHLGLASTF